MNALRKVELPVWLAMHRRAVFTIKLPSASAAAFLSGFKPSKGKPKIVAACAAAQPN